MEYKNKDSEEIEIDLVQVLSILFHWLWLIVLCGLVAGAVAFLVSKFVMTEQYESTTKVYILTKDTNSSVTLSDVQMGTQLTKDYSELIQSRYVIQQVISNLGLNETYEVLKKQISVTSPTDTRIIAITVTDPSPTLARNIANEIRTVSATHITKVMDIQAVNVVEEANLPTVPSSPNKMRNTAIGMLLGVLACIAVIMIQFLIDDSIKTSDDVETYLGLSTLGLIPITEEERKGKKGKKRGRGSKEFDDMKNQASKTKEASASEGIGAVRKEDGKPVILPEKTNHVEVGKGNTSTNENKHHHRTRLDEKRSAETSKEAGDVKAGSDAADQEAKSLEEIQIVEIDEESDRK